MSITRGKCCGTCTVTKTKMEVGDYTLSSLMVDLTMPALGLASEFLVTVALWALVRGERLGWRYLVCMSGMDATPNLQSFGFTLPLYLFIHIKWSKMRHVCAKADNYYPHGRVQRLLWDSVYYIGESVINTWPFNKIRERAVQKAIEYIYYEDESSRYLTIGCVEKSTQTFGSQSWDCALAVQALLACHINDEIAPVLKKAHEFIKKSQVRENPPDYLIHIRHISKGAWTFSGRDHGWQVSDCTAEGLKCCLLFKMLSPDLVGEPMEVEHLCDSVNIILSLLSPNGGLSAWEPAGAPKWSELCPGHRRKEIDNFITKAATTLKIYKCRTALGIETGEFASFMAHGLPLEALRLLGGTTTTVRLSVEALAFYSKHRERMVVGRRAPHLAQKR
ncbi:hypothetical protein TIFTF001_017435 [Ficus carica]|uniref:Squalene cyclase C-terminal domain-containing protein n=1 Tax=Ficus carica TaxID=3494 RepID=A0AA88D9P2_FICCA|nr:hypothetical protein TIFTF001_017435 [Ficus carica]